jgi:hypothetical protein
MKRLGLARLCWALGLVATPGTVVAQADTRATAVPAQPATGDVVSSPTADGPTVFDASAHGAGGSVTVAGRSVSAARPQHSAVRLSEYLAAPYLDRDGGPKGAGELLQSSEMTAVALLVPRSPFQLQELVYIKMPDGVAPEVGQKLLTYRLGESFENDAEVVIPTGVLTVVQPGAPGEVTSARISQMFGVIRLGQYVLPIEPPALPAVGAVAAPIEDGPRSEVAWVDDEAVLPSLQYYVVIRAKPSDNYALGDQITLYRPREREYATNLMLPEEEIAIGQVVRVSGRSVTALVIAMHEPRIRPGIAARMTAKMP